MKRVAPIVLCLLVSLLSAPALAQGDQTALFPRQATLEVGRADGLVRMPVPEDLLRVAQPDFSDVRLIDAEGTEIPYLVESAWHVGAGRGYVRTVEVTPVEIERRMLPRGWVPDASIERLDVIVPAPPRADDRFRLLLDASAPSYVRRVVVSRVEGTERTEIAQGAIYRMDDPARERSTIELPLVSAGTRLAIELHGEGGYLEPRVRFRATEQPLEPVTLDLPLRVRDRRVEGGETILELEGPSGFAADRLRFETEATHFVRRVVVERGSDSWRAGEDTLLRMPEAGVSNLEIDLEAGARGRIRVRITDGDSPPLEDLSVVAVVRAPNLVFTTRPGPHRLLYGGHRVHAPDYDLARAANGALGDRLREADLPLVEAAAPTDNPDYSAGPALEFAMHPGRAVDDAGYSHVAAVHIEGAVEGASRIALTPALIGRAREDLADLRVVDAEGRQWPYLTVRNAGEERVVITAERQTSGDESTYRFELPHEHARVQGFEVVSDAEYVSRDARLIGFDDAGRPHSLHTGGLYRDPTDASAPLVLRFAPTWLTRLELIVTDGSEAPLEVERFEVEVVTDALYLAAPDGDYRLLVGDPDAEPPSYEIERARGLVLSATAVDARVDSPVVNPAHVEAPWYEEADVSSWILWAVLLLAVLVLGGLTFRLAGQGEDEAPPEAEAPEEPVAEPSEAAEEGDDPPTGDGDSSKPLKF